LGLVIGWGAYLLAGLEYVTSEANHHRAVEAIRSMSDADILVEY
jgi:hypothetical protein